jgi:hypothetical protein
MHLAILIGTRNSLIETGKKEAENWHNGTTVKDQNGSMTVNE